MEDFKSVFKNNADLNINKFISCNNHLSFYPHGVFFF